MDRFTALVRRVAELNGVPYLRLQTAKHALVEAVDDFLSSRGAVDAALIFETEAEVTRPCTVLHCSVLNCTVLYCSVQYCTVLYRRWTRRCTG